MWDNKRYGCTLDPEDLARREAYCLEAWARGERSRFNVGRAYSPQLPAHYVKNVWAKHGLIIPKKSLSEFIPEIKKGILKGKRYNQMAKDLKITPSRLKTFLNKQKRGKAFWSQEERQLLMPSAAKAIKKGGDIGKLADYFLLPPSTLYSLVGKKAAPVAVERKVLVPAQKVAANPVQISSSLVTVYIDGNKLTGNPADIVKVVALLKKA